MAPKTANLAILFADVSGSTQLFETLGDAVARVKVAECLATLTNITNEYKGKVIKTIGDEIMSTFPSAEAAAKAAIAMQEEIDEDVTEGDSVDGDIAMRIRVGMHFGPAILESDDVFGDAVNVAARMAAQAKGGQIITSKITVDKLPTLLQASTRFVDRAAIKGKKEEIDIYEIIWQEEDVTRMASGRMVNEDKDLSLILRYHDNEMALDKSKSSLILGRSRNCDLLVNEKLASRQHVRLELRKDKFFIIDQSTNGTFVLFDNAEKAFLRREEMPINSDGRLSLGRGFDEHPEEVVTFKRATS